MFTNALWGAGRLLCALSIAMLALGATLASASDFQSDRITVEVTGAGPDVVLIHGLASSRETWRDLADRLGGRYRLHLVQARGFADEAPPADTSEVWAPMVDEVARYIREEGLSAPALVGHSMGGASGLMLAARHPDVVGKVMVVDALPFYSALYAPQATEAAARPFAESARAQVLSASDETYAAMQQGIARGMVADDDARLAVLAWSMASDRATVAQAMFELMTTDLRPALPAVGAPVTVVYAWHPAMNVGPGVADALYAREYAGLAGVSLVRVDDALHFIMLDQPDAFAAEVERFLAE